MSKLFAEDSPANRSVTPVSNSASTTQDGCGPQWPQSYAQFDPDTLSWRTYQLSFEIPELSEPSWPTFTPSGSMRNGQLFERPTLVRPTREQGSTLWPTPRATMAAIRTNPQRPGRSNLNLEEAVGNTGEGLGYLNPLWVEWLMGFPEEWSISRSMLSATQ